MPPEKRPWDLQAVSFYVNGEQIGTGTISTKADLKPVEGPRPLGMVEGSVTLTDCEINLGAFIPLLGPMDVTVSKGEYLPPRPLRSKKKRIVRKWKKLYTFNKETTTYKNCTITGLEEE